MKNKVKRAAFVVGDLVRCVSEEEHLRGIYFRVLWEDGWVRLYHSCEYFAKDIHVI